MTEWIADGESGASVREKLNLFQPNRVTVNLSSAQILALDGTPVEIVPTPGAGKFIRVLNIITQLTFGTSPYGDSSAGLYYGDGNGSDVDGAKLGNLARRTQDTVALNSRDFANFMRSSRTDLEDKPIVATSIGGSPTGGDGTIKVTIDYVIDTLP